MEPNFSGSYLQEFSVQIRPLGPERTFRCIQLYDLISQRFKMHFDSSLRLVVKTAMNEASDIEVKAVNAIKM